MPHRGTRDLTPATKVAVALFMVGEAARGVSASATVAAAVERFPLGTRSAWRLWKNRTTVSALLAPPRSKRPPKPTKRTKEEVAGLVSGVPLSERQTLRSLAKASGIPRASLWRYLKGGWLRRAVSRVKPTLTTDHKFRRLIYCLMHVQPSLGNSFKMRSMYDTVHIDEKWFNLYKGTARYYLTPDEGLPYRSSPNKRYIGKVMFLAAITRPRFHGKTKKYFDGKIGIWPIVERVPAKRSSSNRLAGTLETKNVSMTRKRYKKLLIEKVFPAIRKKWPGRKNRVVHVQQDNAGPHVSPYDADIVRAGEQDGWNIELMCQPPRSPDLNTLDLGAFCALQALQLKHMTKNLDGLVHAVTRAFNELPSATVDKCFVTLQKVMQCVMIHGGGNDYKLPRVSKYFKGSTLPASQPVTKEVVDNCTSQLNNLM